MSRALLAWVAVLLVVMGATGIWLGVKYAGAGSRTGNWGEVDPTYLKVPADASQKWLKDFTLTDQSGAKVRTQDLAGQVYVTNFFFSSCPGTCLQQNQKILEIAQQYGPKGVRFLSITCDPDNDDPERLSEYGSRLGANPDHWSFLTGHLLYTRRVASEIYQVALDKQTHSERFFVTDKWGNLRGQFAWNQLDQITDMRLLLDRLLAEKEPPEVPENGGQKTEDGGL